MKSMKRGKGRGKEGRERGWERERHRSQNSEKGIRK